MAFSLTKNIALIGAQRSLTTASNKIGESLARASLNAQDAISFLRTAESALNETHSILQRMRELAVQAENAIASEPRIRDLDMALEMTKFTR